MFNKGRGKRTKLKRNRTCCGECESGEEPFSFEVVTSAERAVSFVSVSVAFEDSVCVSFVVSEEPFDELKKAIIPDSVDSLPFAFEVASLFVASFPSFEFFPILMCRE